MEREELEQIPWSALVADVDDRADRRWIWLAALVGVGLAAFLLLRLVLPDGEAPVDEAVPAIESFPKGCEADPSLCVPPPTAGEGAVVVSEADLKAADAAVAPFLDDGVLAAVARAEWFVSDWHTADGSDATAASIVTALAPGVEIAPTRDEENATFVEWARAGSVERTDAGFRVVVLYRQIASSGAGATETESDGAGATGTEAWVRQPVRAVAIDVVTVDGIPLVASEPVLLGDVWQGSS